MSENNETNGAAGEERRGPRPANPSGPQKLSSFIPDSKVAQVKSGSSQNELNGLKRRVSINKRPKEEIVRDLSRAVELATTASKRTKTLEGEVSTLRAKCNLVDQLTDAYEEHKTRTNAKLAHLESSVDKLTEENRLLREQLEAAGIKPVGLKPKKDTAEKKKSPAGGGGSGGGGGNKKKRGGDAKKADEPAEEAAADE